MGRERGRRGRGGRGGGRGGGGYRRYNDEQYAEEDGNVENGKYDEAKDESPASNDRRRGRGRGRGRDRGRGRGRGRGGRDEQQRDSRDENGKRYVRKDVKQEQQVNGNDNVEETNDGQASKDVKSSSPQPDMKKRKRKQRRKRNQKKIETEAAE